MIATALAPYQLVAIGGPAYASRHVLLERPYPGVGDPAVSPNGSEVAFAVWRPDGSSHLEMSSLGGATRTLSNGQADRMPAWSPDGRSIVFVRAKHLAILDVATTSVRSLGVRGIAPTWSR